jgi:glyoxylase-like metal-dependent hydrolase (beta-lactamase superfamily II)
MIKPETAEDQVRQAKRFIKLAGKRLRTFQAGGDVIPEEDVSSLHVPGHTPGMVAYRFQSRGETLMMMGDVWVHPSISLEHPEWRFAFDTNTPIAVESRQRAIKDAVDRNARLVVPHFPWPSLGRIGLRDGRAHWDPDWYGWSHGQVAPSKS